ncbi:MAG: DUF3096 domain-containing protein [archaeon]
MAKRTLSISVNKTTGALILLIAGVLVIVFPHLLAWIVGLALILKGLTELL